MNPFHALRGISERIGGTLYQRLSCAGQVHEDDLPFLTDANAAVLLGARRSSRVLLWATLLFLCIALIWAALAPLDEVTRGDGKVIPTGKIQVIQNLEGGILSELFVKEGDIVEKNQPLMRLDDTRFSSNYQETNLKHLALRAKAARLQAEVDGVEFTVTDELRGKQPQIATGEHALYLSRQNELRSSIGVLDQQAQQHRQELAAMRSRRAQLGRSHGLVSKELAMSAPLAKDGAISEVELLRLERSVSDIRGELDAATHGIPRAEAALNEVERKIEEVKLGFRAKAMTELSDTQAELASLGASIGALEDRVTRTLVRSPVHGIVKQLKIATIGGVVQPGMDLVEVVPLDDSLLVEARIRPSDIAFLHPNQPATVKLTAYDYSIYGGLSAQLEHISADTLTDEEGESYYLIHVRTRRDQLGNGREPLKIIPGMTATVDILTGEKTVLQYLLKPVLKARERALRER